MLEIINIKPPENTNPKINNLVQKIANLITNLYQETDDIAQLNPNARIKSIINIWNSISDKLWPIRNAIDIWSGFWYWVILLSTLWIDTLWVEKVKIKNEQWAQLLKRLWFISNRSSKWWVYPYIYESDFFDLWNYVNYNVDLLTMFYVSGELLFTKWFLAKCYSLLNESWKLLISTHMEIEEIKEAINQLNPEKEWFSVEIFSIEWNFERYVVLLSKQNLT